MIINTLIACYLITAHISLSAQLVSWNKTVHLIAINVVFVIETEKKKERKKFGSRLLPGQIINSSVVS